MGAARAAKAKEIDDLTEKLRTAHEELSTLDQALSEAKQAYQVIYTKARPDAEAANEAKMISVEKVRELQRLVARGGLSADMQTNYELYQASMVDADEEELTYDQWRNVEFASSLSRYLLTDPGPSDPDAPTQPEPAKGVKHDASEREESLPKRAKAAGGATNPTMAGQQ